MENEAVCGWCAGAGYCDCAVSVVAAGAEAGCVVSEYGHAGSHWAVLRHGYRPPDSVYHHHVRETAGSLAVSELVRGRGVFRFVPAAVGVA